MPKVISMYPRHLRDAQCRNFADATADKARHLAGVGRFLYELASGTSGDANDAGFARNPQGTVGIDHSGPPWGSAFKHVLAHWAGGDDDSSDWDRKDQHALGSGASRTFRSRIWVKPFAEGPAVPYSRGYIYIRFKNSAGYNFTVRARANGRDHLVNPSGATTTEVTGATGAYLSLRPGFNDILIDLVNASGTLNLYSLTVAQIVARSH